MVEVVSSGHQRIEVDGARRHEMYCCRPGIGVSEHSGHVDLHVLDVADGQGEVAGAHSDQHDVSGRADRPDTADDRGRGTAGVDERVDLGMERGDVDGSDTTIRAAPKARAACAQMTPIGPAPAMSIDEPGVTWALRMVAIAT